MIWKYISEICKIIWSMLQYFLHMNTCCTLNAPTSITHRIFLKRIILMVGGIAKFLFLIFPVNAHQKDVTKYVQYQSQNSAEISWIFFKRKEVLLNLTFWCFQWCPKEGDANLWSISSFCVDKTETHLKHWMGWNSNLQTVFPLEAWIHRQFLLKLSLITQIFWNNSTWSHFKAN